jgi:hypothetical protein
MNKENIKHREKGNYSLIHEIYSETNGVIEIIDEKEVYECLESIGATLKES